MWKNIILVIVGIVGLIIVVCVWYRGMPLVLSSQYEAEWIFASARDPVNTNKFGNVIQPPNELFQMDEWNYDPERSQKIARFSGLNLNAESHFFYLRSIDGKRKLILKYLKKHPTVDAQQVSNVFASVRYKTDHKRIPVTRVTVRAQSLDVAVGFLSAIGSALLDNVQDEIAYRQRKGSQLIRWQIDCLKQKGEPVPDELTRRLDEIADYCRSSTVKIYTLVPPH